MILDGFFFTATGVSVHGFYAGERCACEILSTVTPHLSRRIHCDNVAWTVPRVGFSGYSSVVPVLDRTGAEAACVYCWGPRRFDIAIPGASLSGRVIDRYPKKAILYTGTDDRVRGRIECELDQSLSRERFGDRFPKQFTAWIDESIGPELIVLALSAPFLGVPGMDTGWTEALIHAGFTR